MKRNSFYQPVPNIFMPVGVVTAETSGLEETKTQESGSYLGRPVTVDTKSRMVKIAGSIVAFIAGLAALGLFITLLSSSFFKVGPLATIAVWLIHHGSGQGLVIPLFLALVLFVVSIGLWPKK